MRCLPVRTRREAVNQSVYSQSLPHSYQRSTWSTYTRSVLDECVAESQSQKDRDEENRNQTTPLMISSLGSALQSQGLRGRVITRGVKPDFMVIGHTPYPIDTF